VACGCGSGGGACACPGRGGGGVVPPAGSVIVFFPMPTTFLGTVNGTLYYSDPVDVTAWKAITVQVGWLAGSPTGGLVETWLETGFDLVSWTKLGGDLNPAQGSTITATRSDPARLLRFAAKITAPGSENIVVLWARAVAREK